MAGSASSPTEYDVALIGSGHQALVAAAYLARAGKRVVVLEAEPTIGGATRSGEVTEPGLVHDLYATNLNLFMGSTAWADFGEDLRRHGFEPVTCDHPYANVYPGGTSLRVYQDQAKTEAGIGAHSAEDLAGWRELHAKQKRFVPALMPMYGMPLPSAGAVKSLVAAVRSEGIGGLLEHGKTLAMSTRELGDAYFATPELKSLLACWGMHLDYGPDVSFGAMFPYVETFGDMEAGITLAKGGISTLPEALAGIVVEHGGEVRTGARVARVLVSGGRAVGVELDGAEQVRVADGGAVVAGTDPAVLVETLLAGEPAVRETTRAAAKRWANGPGTLMVHLALERPLTWAAHEDLTDFAYVHIAPYVDDLARTFQQSLAGLLPDAPLLVVGQTSQVDPTRSPDGRAVVWVQVRTVPYEVRGDAAGRIAGTDWDAIKEEFADRVLDIIEEHAPGAKASVRARTVYSPVDLERSNANLVRGDSVAGSHHVAQNFVFRPWPGASTYRTDVTGLWLCGAGTWPGGGTNAMSGYHVAQAILRGAPSGPAATGWDAGLLSAAGSAIGGAFTGAVGAAGKVASGVAGRLGGVIGRRFNGTGRAR